MRVSPCNSCRNQLKIRTTERNTFDGVNVNRACKLECRSTTAASVKNPGKAVSTRKPTREIKLPPSRRAPPAPLATRLVYAMLGRRSLHPARPAEAAGNAEKFGALEVPAIPILFLRAIWS